MGIRKKFSGHPTITIKIYFRFCLHSTVLYMGLEKKSSIDTCFPPKKNNFVPGHSTAIGHRTVKKLNHPRCSLKKKILATVLLWYMGLRKDSIGTRSPPKKKLSSSYSTTMIHETQTKINLTRPSTE